MTHMGDYSMLIHISLPTIYEYEGWIFEYSRTKPFGPWPLKKDLEPRKKAGNVFYSMFGRFMELSKEEQEECRV